MARLAPIICPSIQRRAEVTVIGLNTPPAMTHMAKVGAMEPAGTVGSSMYPGCPCSPRGQGPKWNTLAASQDIV